MTFGVLIFPDVEELDFVGPWEILRAWSRFLKGPEHCLIVAQSREPVRCANGLSVNPDVAFDTCPDLDFLLVPGGQGTRREVDNPVLIEFVTRQADHCRAVLSVCTGAFLLHRAGLLTGRKATTHWASLQRLRALGDVEVVEERIVHDGTLWSSAGVSAGIDLMLAFIENTAGEDVAARIQLGAEYFPSDRRYGSPHEHEQAPGYLRREG
jgi:transcriptional regulator GlxA family with amidase domain